MNEMLEQRELTKLKMLGISDSVVKLPEYKGDINSLLIIKIEPRVSIQEAIIQGMIYWAGDLKLPGASFQQVRSMLLDLFTKQYGKNTSLKPFKIDGYLFIDMVT